MRIIAFEELANIKAAPKSGPKQSLPKKQRPEYMP